MGDTIKIPTMPPGRATLPILCCCHPDNLIGYFVDLPDTIGDYDELVVFVPNAPKGEREHSFKIMGYGDEEILAVNGDGKPLEFFEKLSGFRKPTAEQLEEWKQQAAGKWKKWRKDDAAAFEEDARKAEADLQEDRWHAGAPYNQ